MNPSVLSFTSFTFKTEMDHLPHTFLFIAGTLRIGNIARESVIYRYGIWDATAIFMFMTVVAAASWIPVVRSPWKLFSQGFPEVYEPNVSKGDRYPATDAVWPGGILVLVLSLSFTALSLEWKRLLERIAAKN